MDDLIEFDSDSDQDEDLMEVLSNEQILKNNRVKLHLWNDVLSAHHINVKELKYYSKEVNAVIGECKLDATRIKCMEWKSGLSLDKLPDHLKPTAFSRCQTHANKTKLVEGYKLKMCKNYTQPCRKPKDNANNKIDDITSHETNSFNISTPQSNITFNFKPNYNINHSSVHINSTKLSNTNSNMISKDNGSTAFDTLTNVQNIRSKVNYAVTSNTSTNSAPHSSIKTNVNNFNKNTSHDSGFNKETELSNNLDNGSSKYFAHSKGTNFRGKLQNNLTNGSTRDVANEETHVDGVIGKDREDPFSFANYYKQQANLGKTREFDRSNGSVEGKHQGTNLNINKEKSGGFRTARTELSIQQMKKDKAKPGGNNQNYNQGSGAGASWVSNSIKKTLGTTKARSVHSKFITPSRPNPEDDAMDVDQPSRHSGIGKDDRFVEDEDVEPVNEKYKGIDKVMIERIENEIMDQGKPVTWDDIAGLTFAKQTIQEVIVWPMLRPDIFTGLRRPPKGILLFGPPGTGKTLIGKCVAAQCRATFFCISASTLTSKWYGEGEKMVRALFAVASVHQPSIIFIDEIDSLLCQRSDQENETSRRLKTEFLISLDGAATEEDDRVLVIGATNRPQELDEAARRRLVKRLYIPLPDEKARCEMVTKLLTNITNSLTQDDIEEVGHLTGTFSGADMASLCREASLGPVRCIDISRIDALDVRPISIQDFRDALKTVRPSVCQADLKIYQEWNQTFGSGRC